MKNSRQMLAGCYILITVFSFLFLCGCERRYYRRDNREYRHFYRDGKWYQRDSLGHEIAVAALAIGALIDALPSSHTTVVVEGAPYYHDDRYYYRQHSNGGYVVVPAPEIVQPHSKSNNDGRRDRGGNRHN